MAVVETSDLTTGLYREKEIGRGFGSRPCFQMSRMTARTRAGNHSRHGGPGEHDAEQRKHVVRAMRLHGTDSLRTDGSSPSIAG